MTNERTASNERRQVTLSYIVERLIENNNFKTIAAELELPVSLVHSITYVLEGQKMIQIAVDNPKLKISYRDIQYKLNKFTSSHMFQLSELPLSPCEENRLVPIYKEINLFVLELKTQIDVIRIEREELDLFIDKRLKSLEEGSLSNSHVQAILSARIIVEDYIEKNTGNPLKSRRLSALIAILDL